MSLEGQPASYRSNLQNCVRRKCRGGILSGRIEAIFKICRGNLQNCTEAICKTYGGTLPHCIKAILKTACGENAVDSTGCAQGAQRNIDLRGNPTPALGSLPDSLHMKVDTGAFPNMVCFGFSLTLQPFLTRRGLKCMVAYRKSSRWTSREIEHIL